MVDIALHAYRPFQISGASSNTNRKSLLLGSHLSAVGYSVVIANKALDEQFIGNSMVHLTLDRPSDMIFDVCLRFSAMPRRSN